MLKFLNALLVLKGFMTVHCNKTRPVLDVHIDLLLCHKLTSYFRGERNYKPKYKVDVHHEELLQRLQFFSLILMVAGKHRPLEGYRQILSHDMGLVANLLNHTYFTRCPTYD